MTNPTETSVEETVEVEVEMVTIPASELAALKSNLVTATAAIQAAKEALAARLLELQTIQERRAEANRRKVSKRVKLFIAKTAA